MFTWDEVIDVALGIEQAGEETYRQAAKTAGDPTIAQTLEWLADDEAQHQKWLANLRTEQLTTQPSSKMEKISRSLMRDLAESQSQFHETEKLTNAESLTAVLTTALKAEKETAQFYELIAMMLDKPEDIKMIEVIIAEEYRHAETLQQWLDEGRLPESLTLKVPVA